MDLQPLTPTVSPPLADLLSRLLRANGELELTPLGEPVEGPAELPLECGVRLGGRLEGLLVLRTREALVRRIHARSVRREGSERETFEGLAVLFCVHWLLERHPALFWELAPLIPRRTGPRDWPRRPPDESCALLAGAEPIEARLWITERNAS